MIMRSKDEVMQVLTTESLPAIPLKSEPSGSVTPVVAPVPEEKKN